MQLRSRDNGVTNPLKFEYFHLQCQKIKNKK